MQLKWLDLKCKAQGRCSITQVLSIRRCGVLVQFPPDCLEIQIWNGISHLLETERYSIQIEIEGEAGRLI